MSKLIIAFQDDLSRHVGVQYLPPVINIHSDTGSEKSSPGWEKEEGGGGGGGRYYTYIGLFNAVTGWRDWHMNNVEFSAGRYLISGSLSINLMNVVPDKLLHDSGAVVS